jgi:hypothetical protein
MSSAVEQSQEQEEDQPQEWTAEMLEQWWQAERKKIKPLDKSYHEYTFSSN